MFPCVWLHFKKFSGKYFLVFGKEEGKHKSRKNHQRSRDQRRWRRRDLAIDASRDRTVDRDQRRGQDRDLRSRLLMIFFLGLSFPSSFPNIRKYFPKNFLKCNQTHGNIFLFRKLAFPENMYFPENVLRQPNTALKE